MKRVVANRRRGARTTMLTACYRKDGRWWLAEVLEARNVATQGRSLAEARANLADAIEALLLSGSSVEALFGHRKKHTVTRAKDPVEAVLLVKEATS